MSQGQQFPLNGRLRRMDINYHKNVGGYNVLTVVLGA